MSCSGRRHHQTPGAVGGGGGGCGGDAERQAGGVLLPPIAEERLLDSATRDNHRHHHDDDDDDGEFEHADADAGGYGGQCCGHCCQRRDHDAPASWRDLDLHGVRCMLPARRRQRGCLRGVVKR